VANGSPYTYAGRLSLPIAREADFGRGLDLVAPIEVAPLALPSVAARVLSGHAQDRRFIREHDLDRIEIRCDVPLPLHADGEDLGDVAHAVFEAERDAVSVLV
jgi:diacylglycerol kinase family enzyme